MVTRDVVITNSDVVAGARALKAVYSHAGDDFRYAFFGGVAALLYVHRAIENDHTLLDEKSTKRYWNRRTHDIDIVVNTDYIVDFKARDGTAGALTGSLEGGRITWNVHRFLPYIQAKKKIKFMVADQIEVHNEETGHTFVLDIYSRKGRGPFIGDAHIPIERFLSSPEQVMVRGERIPVASLDVIYESKIGMPPEKRRDKDKDDIKILGLLRGLQEVDSTMPFVNPAQQVKIES